MSAIKTPFGSPIMPDFTDMGGQLPTSRGTDPNISVDGSSGLNPVWSNAPVSSPDGQETSNSVSGLPSLPNRYQPAEQPPGPPDLTTRSPGTIDR